MTPAITAWLPKSVLLLRGSDRRKLLSDLIAGVTVGLVALQLAMAFAIASGVSPQAGIYCAIVTGFLISALGGSKTQIGGPTGAFVVVISGIIAKYGIGGLFACTMMAGVLLVLLGITGMGTAVKYFPRPSSSASPMASPFSSPAPRFVISLGCGWITCPEISSTA
jgi:sulfate permease, SulP family